MFATSANRGSESYMFSCGFQTECTCLSERILYFHTRYQVPTRLLEKDPAILATTLGASCRLYPYQKGPFLTFSPLTATEVFPSQWALRKQKLNRNSVNRPRGAVQSQPIAYISSRSSYRTTSKFCSL